MQIPVNEASTDLQLVVLSAPLWLETVAGSALLQQFVMHL